MDRTIALTGATGFIGSSLAPRLAAAGWQVRALVRPSSSRARLAGLSPEWIEGDLDDAASLRRLVSGAEVVVHCAGIVRGTCHAQFYRVNAEGVARLAEAALEQDPVPRFLLISSLAAREPALSPYAASKRQGEIALSTAGRAMAWTALRPPAVYGPGDRGLLPLFRWMERGIAPVLGQDGARFSLLYVEDLADAVLHWLGAGHTERSTFELDDGHPNGYAWEDVIEAVSRLRSRRVRRVRVPQPLLALLAWLNVMAARAIGHAPMLTPGKVRELTHPNWVCDNAAFSRVTDWRPRVSLEEGLRLTLGGGAPMTEPLLGQR